MTERKDTDNVIDQAALDVLTLARSSLTVKLRFLDMALGRLDMVPSDDATYATDGIRFVYGPKHVLRSFKSEHDRPAQEYLHVVLHCIFSHMFIGALDESELWDLACDIAVENTIYDLGIRAGDASRKTAQRAEIERLRTEVGMLTAEKLYRHYADAELPGHEIERLRRIFRTDDHSGWHKKKPPHHEEDGSEAGNKYELSDEKSVSFEEKADEILGADDTRKVQSDEVAEDWKKIAEKIQEDLETFSREQGDAAGGMMQNLSEVNRERYDYGAFLKKFSVFGENMAVNDEEFDYIFYTYGLKLYGNMPLVEPLEYKEVRRIREFVIAIDTSGSTSGELVQRFLQKTYNILKSSESFFSRINVHIIQCDAAIQEHVKITSDEEFDDYIGSMTVRGLGGTDFRPVFELVDRLNEEGEFSDLKGMIYFTDGRGSYPSRKPAYETAFVFLDNEYNEPEVPPWAIRLVLRNEDI